MRNFSTVHYLLAGLVLLCSCEPKLQSELPQTGNENKSWIIHSLNSQLSETIIRDGFPPPVGARAFAYPNIAAYEVLALGNDNFISLAGQLNGLKPYPDAIPENIIPEIAMVTAFSKLAVNMVYRDYLIEERKAELITKLTTEENKPNVEKSVKTGEDIAQWIIDWASHDNYKETRSMPRFEITRKPGTWVPTSPKYGEAVEPHWAKVRPFVMDSAGQFSNYPPPYPYSEDPNSDFYKMAKEVYDIVNFKNAQNLEIAKHWDCNPAVSVNRGHFMALKRQQNPSGHWMGITRLVANIANLDLMHASEAYTLVAITLTDAFISVWDEKYKSNVIRPETYINLFIDPNWNPLLETPLFPEHVSGHSGISMATATVLTKLFGENYPFTDSVEVDFGGSPRNYNSFKEAAKEAAISRMYAGIHYRPACELGMKQGEAIGKYIVNRLATRK